MLCFIFILRILRRNIFLVINKFELIFSRAVGYRFGPHLGDTVPVLINYCTNASENDEELREYSLQVPCLFIISNLSTLKCIILLSSE